MLCSVSIFSCAKQEPTVKHVMKAGEGPNLKNVKVVNEDDPVCHMKTAEFLKIQPFIKEVSTGSAVTIVRRPSRRILINMYKNEEQ